MQHVANAVARDPPPLLSRQVLLHHPLSLEALLLDAARFDEGLANAAVQVLSLGVARRNHHTTGTIRDEIPRDHMVSQAGIRDLDHTAGLFEEAYGAPGTPRVGSGHHHLAEPLVPLTADHVQPLGPNTTAVGQQ